MHNTGYGLGTEILSAKQGVRQNVVLSAVANAAEKTGVDFTYLLEKASQESGFNPKAKAKNSSALGLFQFIENTWLSMIAKFGTKHGLGEYADKISVRDNGKAVVADHAARREILALRKDPAISALMAGEFTAENKNLLEDKVEGVIGPTELYMAHFLGAGSAAKFLNALHKNPGAKAANLFPEAAAANPSVFHSRSGRARSLNEIYAMFDRKFTDGAETLVAKINPDGIQAPTSRSPDPDAAPYGDGAYGPFDSIGSAPDFFKSIEPMNSLLVAQVQGSLADVLTDNDNDSGTVRYGRYDINEYAV